MYRRNAPATYSLLFCLLACLSLLACQANGPLNEYGNEPAADSTRPTLAQPYLIRTSEHGFDRTVENVRRAINGMNFLLIREQELTDGFTNKDDAGREHVIYFCNFEKVNHAIKSDFRVGQFLPCRVTVMERNGKVYVSSINPKRLSLLLNNGKLERLCDEMYEIYETVLNEATF